MKRKYLAVFLGTEESSARKWGSLTDAEKKERSEKGAAAWGAWAKTHAAAIVDHGAPLGKTKNIGDAGVKDIRNAMAAYVIVEAESHEAAAKMFVNHPHFAIFPGDSVDVVACLSMDEIRPT